MLQSNPYHSLSTLLLWGCTAWLWTELSKNASWKIQFGVYLGVVETSCEFGLSSSSSSSWETWVDLVLISEVCHGEMMDL